MEIRDIVTIDEDKCDGCGLCIPNCMEGAIKIIDGKAKLIGDNLCDGMGNCLGHCPQDAIKIIKREAEEFDEALVMEVQKKEEEKAARPEEIQQVHPTGGCPGSMSKLLQKKKEQGEVKEEKQVESRIDSELNQWPVQLKLVSPSAPYFKGADLLIAADCTAYAYGNFHKEFIKGKITLIGCPKLDDVDYYKGKLKEIFENDIKSITVVRMSVPCCSGIVAAVKAAMLEAGKIVNYKEVIIGTDGEIV